MQRFEARELRRFLKAVDDSLDHGFELWRTGGSAAALGYGVRIATKALDTLDARHRSIAHALEAARQSTGLNVPIDVAATYDAPRDFEERGKIVPIEGLKRLVVKVPEKHDLVLMKMVRGEEPDLEVAEAILSLHGLDKDLLLDRYLNEMDAVIGQREIADLNFLALVFRLYGEGEEREAKARIEARRRRERSE
jgi:hypothetical protein